MRAKIDLMLVKSDILTAIQSLNETLNYEAEGEVKGRIMASTSILERAYIELTLFEESKDE